MVHFLEVQLSLESLLSHYFLQSLGFGASVRYAQGRPSAAQGFTWL